jgi:hypothetical protein
VTTVAMPKPVETSHYWQITSKHIYGSSAVTTLHFIKFTGLENYIKSSLAHETATCHNPCNSSNWDSHITRQLGYKHTFCQMLGPQKYCLSLYFCKNMPYLSVGLLMNCQVITISWKTVYGWVMTNCCSMNNFLNQK